MFLLFEIRKIAVGFLWLSLPGDYRVTDEALLAETTWYDPPSFLWMFSLLLKDLIYGFYKDQIVENITENNFFSPEQHGFISGKSCTTQLLEFSEYFTEALDNGKDIDEVYLDFCKAFDKVPHKRLLKKLLAY